MLDEIDKHYSAMHWSEIAYDKHRLCNALKLHCLGYICRLVLCIGIAFYIYDRHRSAMY